MDTLRKENYFESFFTMGESETNDGFSRGTAVVFFPLLIIPCVLLTACVLLLVVGAYAVGSGSGNGAGSGVAAVVLVLLLACGICTASGIARSRKR